MSQASTKGRVYAGVSLEDRQRQRRDRLIESAILLFGSVGFYATGVRAICAHAGLSERYFYESFQSRDELLLAAFNHVCDEAGAQMISIAQSDGPPQRKARNLLRAYFGYIHGNPEAARVMLIEVFKADPPFDELYRRIGDVGGLMYWALKGEPPNFREGSSEIRIMHGLGAAIAYTASRWRSQNYDAPMDEVIGIGLNLARAILVGKRAPLG